MLSKTDRSRATAISVGAKAELTARLRFTMSFSSFTDFESPPRVRPRRLKPLTSASRGSSTLSRFPTASAARSQHITVPTSEVVFQIADLLGGGMKPETIRRCLTSLAIVIERGTQWGGRVELPGLGSFICQIDPDGTPNLVFRDGVG